MVGSSLPAYDLKTYIPKRAYIYYPLVIKEVERIQPDFILPPYYGALIEHESCIRLTYKKCWNPYSELKTSREQGVGLGQLTRAWRNGKLRFDSLRNLRRRHYKELSELTWYNIKDRPDLQIRAIVLMWSDNFRRLKRSIDYYDRIAMADSAYNGGFGGLRKDIKKCYLTKGCNSNKWFDNVELTCTKSKRPLYGNRSACDINRYHVRDVLDNRLNKYIQLWFSILNDNKSKR